ncbi:MAG: hypothetical protein GY862_08175 [Gammaproteobacteria bacterium]|nr:hypothetical protein [Gammaproteobacteria bacterium]
MSKVQTQGHALIVGAGADLKCTADDAKGLATILKDEERCAYPAGQVQLLTEADLAGHTRERVPQLTNNKQHPVLHFEQADNFVIVYDAAGKEQPKALPFELKAEDGMADPLAQSVKNIEDLFVRARYDQAYTQFHRLCGDYPDYQTQASMILTRYRDLQNQVISGIIPLSQQNSAKLEIAAAFQACLRQFKTDFELF